MVVGIGALYVAYGGLSWMQAVFYGVGAAVIGILIKSAHKLTKLTLKNKSFLWSIFGIMCLVTAYTEQENIWLFLLAGIVSLLISMRPRILLPTSAAFLPWLGIASLPALASISSKSLATIFWYFLGSGLFVFGSGLAIVPFLHGGVVQQYHWLTERQFLDAIAVAMITPGPVVITVGFIGYIVAGLPGAILAALGVFLPVYKVVILFAKMFERYGTNPKLAAFVEGVTAAATGAIAGAVIVLGRRAIADWPTALIAIGSLVALWRWKIPEVLVVLFAGVLGFFIHPAL